MNMKIIKKICSSIATMLMIPSILIAMETHPERNIVLGCYIIKNHALGVDRDPHVGALSWTGASPSGYYAQVLNDKPRNYYPTDKDKYLPQGSYRNSIVWEISQAEDGAYTLKNCGLEGGLLTWVNERTYSGYYAQVLADNQSIIGRNYYPIEKTFYIPGGKYRNDVLWKISLSEISGKYLIKNIGSKFNNADVGFLCWTQQESKSGHYAQVLEGGHYDQYRNAYLEGGQYRNSMLWELSKVESPNSLQPSNNNKIKDLRSFFMEVEQEEEKQHDLASRLDLDLISRYKLRFIDESSSSTLESLNLIIPGKLGLFCQEDKLYCKIFNKDRIEITVDESAIETTKKGLSPKVFDKIIRTVKDLIKPEFFSVATQQEDEREQNFATFNFDRAFESMTELEMRALFQFTSLWGYTVNDNALEIGHTLSSYSDNLGYGNQVHEDFSRNSIGERKNAHYEKSLLSEYNAIKPFSSLTINIVKDIFPDSASITLYSYGNIKESVQEQLSKITGHTGVRRILEIEGSGIRGLLPIIELSVLEGIINSPINQEKKEEILLKSNSINRRIYIRDIFNVGTGTSTGSIVATRFFSKKNYSSIDIVRLYVHYGYGIFDEQKIEDTTVVNNPAYLVFMQETITRCNPFEIYSFGTGAVPSQIKMRSSDSGVGSISPIFTNTWSSWEKLVERKCLDEINAVSSQLHYFARMNPKLEDGMDKLDDTSDAYIQYVIKKSFSLTQGGAFANMVTQLGFKMPAENELKEIQKIIRKNLGS